MYTVAMGRGRRTACVNRRIDVSKRAGGMLRGVTRSAELLMHGRLGQTWPGGVCGLCSGNDCVLVYPVQEFVAQLKRTDRNVQFFQQHVGLHSRGLRACQVQAQSRRMQNHSTARYSMRAHAPSSSRT